MSKVHTNNQKSIINHAITIGEKHGNTETLNYKIQLDVANFSYVSVNILDKKTLKTLNVREYLHGMYSDDNWIFFDETQLLKELREKRQELKL